MIGGSASRVPACCQSPEHIDSAILAPRSARIVEKIPGEEAKQQQASLLPPSERVFASLLDDRGLDRQGLDTQGLSALSGTFFRAKSMFLPEAGRKEQNPRARKRR
jgi:hypothetical protein